MTVRLQTPLHFFKAITKMQDISLQAYKGK